MTGQADPYVRVYYRIIDDPRFEFIYHDARALGTWLQLLLAADAMYPAPAAIPAHIHRPSLKLLVDAGLIELGMHTHYVVHGLAVERERRAQIGRNGAAVRWQNERNAEQMHLRAEPNRAEPIRANAMQTHNPERDIRAQPQQESIACDDYQAHRSQHMYIAGVGWKCLTCEKKRATDGPSLKEKLDWTPPPRQQR